MILSGDLDESWHRRALKSRNRLGRTTGLRQSHQIGLHCLLVFESSESLAKDLSSAGVGRNGNPVMHPLAVPASGDDAGAPQIGEMAGDLRLRTTQDFDEVADADLLISHEVQDPETGLVPQGLEEAFQIELTFLSHDHIFALTDVRVKNIFAVADMFCGGRRCQSSCWIQ